MASRDLKQCVPALQEAVPKIIEEYEAMFPSRSLVVLCTSRSCEEQWELFKIGRVFMDLTGVVIENPSYADAVADKIRVKSVNNGRKVTTLDGVKKFSKHNVSPERPLAEAVDFGVFINGKYMAGPKDTELYVPLAKLSKKYGLRHGSEFPKWKDWPHIETV